MATDYPHAQAAEKFAERTVGDLAKNSKLSEATRRKIPVGDSKKDRSLSAASKLISPRNEDSRELKTNLPDLSLI
jgi:hypothetical protein